MNINLTLIGQSITFFVFIWFCMKYVWPPIMHALNERKTKIADGLAAADKGKHEEELARQGAAETLRKAKAEAAEIIAHAQKRAGEIMEEAKVAARAEADRLVHAANAEIEQETNRAREVLRGQVVKLAVAGAGKVLKREINEQANEDLLKDLVSQL
ncbi:MAG: F0F1 ATP synthase subunit B [Gammaproteobacteria bacterium]|nr:F0F1 ATP synthase subunit B [Gammaproteobacteria bacterium]MDH5650523.1 F0F1 ATP synthase subunit B [Gammaproteobacteria bacterium]